MMGRKEFSYPNLGNIKILFIQYIKYLFFWEKFSKNYSRGIFLKMLMFNNVHPSLYLWTHEMGVGNGILINCKRPWITSYKLEKKSKEPIGYMKPNFWLQKVEKLLHIEDPSLKKESGKHKKKWNWKTQKIKVFFETDLYRGILSLFFYFIKTT